MTSNLPFSEEQLQFMTTQRQIIYDCVRSCVYFRKLSNKELLAEPYTYIKAVLGSDAVLGWSKIFGSNTTEKHHWKNFIKYVNELPFQHNGFNRENILKATNLTNDEWDKYHSDVLVTRNKVFAHTDSYNVLIKAKPVFQNLDPMMKSASCYYSWLYGLWNAAREYEPLYKKVNNNFSRDIAEEIEKFESEADAYLSF